MSVCQPRIMLYSHDTFGLGHLRRTLAIAGRLARDLPRASQLIVTGSMVAGAFNLPPHLDLIKLPALSKRSNGRYKARTLPLSLSQTIAWRQQMILEAARAFQPDLILVDKTPAGVLGEMLPLLRHVKTWRPDARLVLGMRDIEDDPKTTRAEWEACDARRLHEEVYDRLLLYGERRVFDPVKEYGMSPLAAAKLVECGYLGRHIEARSPEAVRRELGADGRNLIVVTAGGGGDGFDLLSTYLDAVASGRMPRATDSLLVTGPLMARHQRELLRSAACLDHVTLVEFTPDLVSYLAAADLVVSMAGYNTVCEILTLGARSLLVPRERPRLEQRLRAERLSDRGLARVLLPDDLEPARLASEIEAALAAPRPHVTLDLQGLARTSTAIAALLHGGQARSALTVSSPGRGTGRQQVSPCPVREWVRG